MKLILLLFLFHPYLPHTYEDTLLLADVMWLENGHTGKTEQENIECLILTGVVPVNRVKNGGWGGDNLHDVIYAKGQYASSTKKGIGKTDTPQYVIDLAEGILTYGTNIPDYVVFQSMQPNLGTVWKVIDGEYFATQGGHKHEGDNFHPEINSANNFIRRSITNNIGNPVRTGHFITDMVNLRRFYYSIIINFMAMVHR